MSGPRRICLFAGYNPSGRVATYVLDYVKELARYADVYYLADGELGHKDRDNLLQHCKGAWGVSHGKYDFGSYAELAQRFVGWPKISRYDELILANDSCMCLQPFDQVFAAMDAKECGAWCLLATDEYNLDRMYSLDEYAAFPEKKLSVFCMGSYFVAFRKPVLELKAFQDFLNGVKAEKNRLDVCLKYELGLTALMRQLGVKMSAYVDIVYRNVAVYGEQAFRLHKKGFPLLKVQIFKTNPMQVMHLRDHVGKIIAYTGSSRILEYLKDVGVDLEPRALPRPKLAQRIVPNLMPPLFRGEFKHALKQVSPPVLVKAYAKAKRKLKGMKKAPRDPHAPISRPPPSAEARALLTKASASKYLVIYFNVARDLIGGGMLSINRFAEKTRGLEKEFGFQVLVSGIPLANQAVDFSRFQAAMPMIAFDEIIAATRPERAILHIPEVFLQTFLEELDPVRLRWLKAVPWLQINILDQNHDLFPPRHYVERCRDLTDDVTVTTAHLAYTTQDLADETDCPVGLLTPFLPKFYRTDFEEKEKTIVLSPDDEVPPGSITKAMIIDRLRTELSDYDLVVIENMSLEQYKQTISKARFAITFGEGYDGYYLEPFLSNSVGFAVFNESFFPAKFKDAPTVYPDWDALYSTIVKDIRRFEANPAAYRAAQKKTEALILSITNDQRSLQNLRSFYRRSYSFLPAVFRDRPLFARGSDLIVSRSGGSKRTPKARSRAKAQPTGVDP